jgi:hypothetical protein
MRTILYQIILLLAGIFFVPQVSGQNGMSDIDTVAFIVPNMHKNSFKFLTRAANISEFFEWGGNLYKFFDRGAKEIQYGDLQSKFVQYKADPTLRNIGDGAMTLITGIGFNSTTDGNWEISGKVKCNDTLPDWNVLMFCEGYVETERERVRNEDDFNSVATNHTSVYNWAKNATGILIEGNDTIGFFRIIMNPREDSLLKSLSADIIPHHQIQRNANLRIKSDLSQKTAAEIDFGITGTFCEKNFSIISNGTDRKTWIFIDNVFMSMFQEYRAISRKDQIMPYLLVNKDIPGPDRHDQVRLAIMSRFMNAVLNQP